MKRILAMLVVTMAGLTPTPVAASCSVCNGPFGEIIYLVHDRVTDERKQICGACVELPTRCYLCGLPAKDNLTELRDGRVLCSRDAKDVILDDEEAKRICAEALSELSRLFSRFTTFPETNSTVEIVNRTRMDQLVQTPGFDRQCPSVNGYIRSRLAQGGQWKHPISILGAVPRARLTAVYAHEMAHAWARENVPHGRDLDRAAEEGFCELVAYRLLENLGQTDEMKVIRENLYTEGQFTLFEEADTELGFYAIMQWMKWGVYTQLSKEEPDRVRQIREPVVRPAAVSEVRPLVIGPTPVPDRLTLTGILGTGAKRLALINDRSLGTGESGRVRFAATNASVRCVEIRTNSVVIEVGDDRRREELFLKGN